MIGNLKKLRCHFETPIEYTLDLGSDFVPLNQFIHTKVSLQFLGEINCVQCNRKTSKSFQQGHCYPCYQRLLECNLCIIHPERCAYPAHECPDDWAHAHCKQQHIVYLANSSGLKIGITRESQIPTRWMDQGAVQAIPLFKVKNRYLAGLLEVTFKKYVADKTNWRKMLQVEIPFIDLHAEKNQLLENAKEALAKLTNQYSKDIELLDSSTALQLQYPLSTPAQSLNAFNFDKEPQIQGILMGIKGQYLILDQGVLNIRKFSGYKIEFKH